MSDYYIRLTDKERENIQLSSFNFYRTYGRMMKVPPRLYEDLKAGGVSMTYIEADPRLEDYGAPPDA